MTFKGELREFQIEVVERMLSEHSLLLALDMGLGKTIVCIYACEHLIESGEASGGLIIVPASLKYQWQQQIEKFTGGDAVTLVVNGTPKERQQQYRRIKAGEVEYAILNYEQVVNDWEYVRHLPYDWVILDEAQAVKHASAQRTKKVMKLHPEYRFALTGRPIETRPEEVFIIMKWVDPAVLGREDIFDQTFIKRDPLGRVKYYKNLAVLHERLNTGMIRKTRDEVKDQLPQVVEPPPVLVDFDIQGAKLYRLIVKDLQGLLAEAAKYGVSFNLQKHYAGESEESNALRGQIMARVTCLRMLCDHPELLRISAQRFTQATVPGSGVSGGSLYAAQIAAAGLIDPLKKAPKFEEALDLIDELLDEKAKVVLFSWFRPTLGFFQDALQERFGVGSVQFHGGMNAKLKDAAKTQFEQDSECKVFLSTDAGGSGLDLPNANFLLNYDLPPSSGKWDQRNGRIIRLSSEFESVTLLNTLMAGSLEQRQYDSLLQQQAIASAVVDGKFDRKTGRLNLSLATLGEYLRSSTV